MKMIYIPDLNPGDVYITDIDGVLIKNGLYVYLQFGGSDYYDINAGSIMLFLGYMPHIKFQIVLMWLVNNHVVMRFNTNDMIRVVT
jgi:hypothetical protein